MINPKYAKSYCKDDISKIENYDLAISDSAKWVCHHRLEITIDGKFAHTKPEMIRMNMYYQRPYFELIFLKESEHRKLHNQSMSDEHRQKIIESNKRRIVSEETKRKISASNIGKKLSEEQIQKMIERQRGKQKKRGYKLSEETRKKMSLAHAGQKRKPCSEETKQKISAAHKARFAAKKEDK